MKLDSFHSLHHKIYIWGHDNLISPNSVSLKNPQLTLTNIFYALNNTENIKSQRYQQAQLHRILINCTSKKSVGVFFTATWGLGDECSRRVRAKEAPSPLPWSPCERDICKSGVKGGKWEKPITKEDENTGARLWRRKAENDMQMHRNKYKQLGKMKIFIRHTYAWWTRMPLRRLFRPHRPSRCPCSPPPSPRVTVNEKMKVKRRVEFKSRIKRCHEQQKIIG